MPEMDTLARIRIYIAQRPAALYTVLEDETFTRMLGDFDGPGSNVSTMTKCCVWGRLKQRPKMRAN